MAMVGFAGSATAGSSDPDPTAMEIFLSSATVRGIQTGSNEDLLRMVKAIEQNNVKPYVREVFRFEDAPKAFRCLEGRSFVGKVCISNE
jgi:D-arabinose 1-dehydrogenase-like Zn-dependent alcohol dehydrogenase